MRRIMCSPEYFDIEYVINPWMDTNIRVDKERAYYQWNAFIATLRDLGDEIDLVEPDPRCPDMTFSGDAGLVIDKTFVPSNFRVEERKQEINHYIDWFRKRGFAILNYDRDIAFEGLGDIVFHGKQAVFGHGVRSDIRCLDILRSLVPELEILCHMKIIDDHFFHLAMALAFLDENTVLYYPSAFDENSCAALKTVIPDVIEVSDTDARKFFACNNLVIGRNILIDNCTPELETALNARGFDVIKCDMSEFKKSGGSLRCLVLSFIETT